jgi:hypothetical protein
MLEVLRLNVNSVVPACDHAAWLHEVSFKYKLLHTVGKPYRQPGRLPSGSQGAQAPGRGARVMQLCNVGNAIDTHWQTAISQAGGCLAFWGFAPVGILERIRCLAAR